MQMKNKVDGSWQEMYPVTKSENVKMDTGESLQEFVDYLQIDTGAIDNETGVYQSGFYVKLPGNYAILSYTGVVLNEPTSNGFLRRTIYFPFTMHEDYTVTMSIRSESGDYLSVSETLELHHRLRSDEKVQISSRKPSGTYVQGDEIVVDVQIMGRIK